MAVEAKRGCGYRKVGGLYLVGGGLSAPCDRMPFPLERCKVCGGGIKFTRGPQWLLPEFFTPHEGCHDEPASHACPVCRSDVRGQPITDSAPHLLLWIGRKHYTPEAYLEEGRKLGVSRRLSAMPKGLVLGETWVLLAHLDAVAPKTGRDGKPICAECGVDHSRHVVRPSGEVWCPAESDDVKFEAIKVTDYEPTKPTPGIFCAFVPRAVELILKQSEATPERIEKEQKRGVTVVSVPDDDRDHHGSVWDKDEEDSQPELPGVAS